MERRQDKTEFLSYLVSAWGGFLRVKTADTKRGGHLAAGNNGVEGNVRLINKKKRIIFFRTDTTEYPALVFQLHLPGTAGSGASV
jgi:hypothetical protein